MKMCSISVAPMPSMMRRPVRWRQASKVGSGSGSPAETHLLRLERSHASALPCIIRYAVGEVKQTLARNSWIA
jgi:hypothetical protein